MIIWKLYRGFSCGDLVWYKDIEYNNSSLLFFRSGSSISYKLCRLLVKDIEMERLIMMDILEHKFYLLIEDGNFFKVRELLGI
jgi:hypothetical protein